MPDLALDPHVAARMGHEDAVAATSIDADGILIEFALLPPEYPNGSKYQREWTVAIHHDCDPDMPSRGASGLEPCGEDRQAAEEHYLEAIREVKADLAQVQAGPGGL